MRSVLIRMHVLDPARELPGAVGEMVRAARSESGLASSDLHVLVDAYQYAAAAHEGQFRKSGEPYIMHPVEVTRLLAAVGMDRSTLVAALLHDVVEDTPIELSEIEDRFGPVVAHLVDGVTKIDQLDVSGFDQSDPAGAQAATLRKLVLSMADDMRVLLIKLADRLHNMRTIGVFGEEKQRAKASETLGVYAPLAHRLGMQQFKRELEDLCFSILHPDEFARVTALIEASAPDRAAAVGAFETDLVGVLRREGLVPDVTGRPKHAWSVWRKTTHRGVPFDEIMDLIAVRVIVSSVAECYQALGLLHHRWTPVPGRFKDYIAAPRPNMYRSLHTVVMADSGLPVEVQIRTAEMHATAEWGVAAHYSYKYGDAAAAPDWVGDLTFWQHDIHDPAVYLKALSDEVSSEDVYVLTPKGEIKALPAGATPVDFAYAVHTEVGHRCIGAKVNGSLAGLDTVLSSGDQVEILTSKGGEANPTHDWLNFVVSQSARAKIRAHFNREAREHALELGQRRLSSQLRKRDYPLAILRRRGGLDQVAGRFGRSGGTELLRSVGDGSVDAREVADHIVDQQLDANPDELDATPIARPVVADPTPPVLVDGHASVETRTADCCQPYPPVDVVGYVTRHRGVSLHRADCPNLEDLGAQDPARIVDAEWEHRSQTSAERHIITIYSTDRSGLVRDLTALLADAHINLRSLNSGVDSSGTVRVDINAEISDLTQLDHALAEIEEQDGVFRTHTVRDR